MVFSGQALESEIIAESPNSRNFTDELFALVKRRECSKIALQAIGGNKTHEKLSKFFL